MTQIIPAIIPESLEHLTETLGRISAFTHDVQIDIVDGEFVPFTSWPYMPKGDITDIEKLTDNFIVEVDLMVMEPEKVIAKYAKAGVRRIVLHLESVYTIDHIVSLRDTYGFELGLSIANDTDIRALTTVIEYADYVQLMGIGQIGTQRQPFDTRVLARIEKLLLQYPALSISIDGSVNNETLPLLKNAGAERFVVGSAILDALDAHSAYTKLVSL
jgi:ribulose-phosphate 3-epimerase